MLYKLCKLTPDHVPAIMELQYAYQRAYPGAEIIPGDIYRSPVMRNGENVICAVDDDGIMRGYAAASASIPEDTHLPAKVWSVVRVDPAIPSLRPLHDILFDAVLELAGDLVRQYDRHGTSLIFKHDTGETDIIAFLVSRGCTHMESVLRLLHDLSHEPLGISSPDGIVIRPLDTEHRQALEEYIVARNENFPHRAMKLRDWLEFYRTSIANQGKVIVAYDGPGLAGSILVYRNEALNQSIHMKLGITEDVFVREPWRNKGIASRLMLEGFLYFKECRLDYASLEVRAGNEPAVRLYRKLGYKTVGESHFYSLKLEDALNDGKQW